MVINDQFSKYLQIYLVNDRTAEWASTCIKNYFLPFSVPKKFCSDRDSSHEADISLFWKEWELKSYEQLIIFHTEAVARKWSVKKVFLKISSNSQENICARVSFLIMLQT